MLAGQFFLHVGLQLTDDMGIQLFEVELSHGFDLSLVYYVKDALHVFFRQLLDVQP